MTDGRADATITLAIGGDDAAIASVVANAMDTDDARMVALAALLTSRVDWIARAHRLAMTTRDRQVVAISASYLAGEHDLVQMLARDHLADHPDSLIVEWIACGLGHPRP
jgi:uncharacterized protein YbaP (TraB family)